MSSKNLLETLQVSEFFQKGLNFFKNSWNEDCLWKQFLLHRNGKRITKLVMVTLFNYILNSQV